MLLSDEEKAMAAGDYGPGVQRCIDILIKFGDAFGAEKMVPLKSAHTMPKEPLKLLFEMTAGATKAGTFTTLHPVMSGFSPVSWQKMGIAEEFAGKEATNFQKREEVYRRIGFHPTYTCLPMLVGNVPLQGDFVSWIGTGAQLLVNSLLGARCNRDGTIINLASAVTGRTPYRGLFLDENRYAEVCVKLSGLDPVQLSHAELGAIGYYVGEKAGNRNVVFDGLPRNMDFDQLKYLIAPLSVTGSVSICHIAGLTPEAPSLEAALNGREPAEVLTVDRGVVDASMAQYAADDTTVDMAVFGCPHCTVPEAKKLAGLLDRKRIRGDKRLWVGMPYQQYFLAQQMGYTDIVEKAGGVFASSCMATIPESPIPDGVKVIATNSFKAAHYITRLTKYKVTVVVRDMKDCVNAVVRGADKRRRHEIDRKSN